MKEDFLYEVSKTCFTFFGFSKFDTYFLLVSNIIDTSSCHSSKDSVGSAMWTKAYSSRY